MQLNSEEDKTNEELLLSNSQQQPVGPKYIAAGIILVGAVVLAVGIV